MLGSSPSLRELLNARIRGAADKLGLLYTRLHGLPTARLCLSYRYDHTRRLIAIGDIRVCLNGSSFNNGYCRSISVPRLGPSGDDPTIWAPEGVGTTSTWSWMGFTLRGSVLEGFYFAALRSLINAYP